MGMAIDGCSDGRELSGHRILYGVRPVEREASCLAEDGEHGAAVRRGRG